MKRCVVYLSLLSLILSACNVGGARTKTASQPPSQTPDHTFTQIPEGLDTPFIPTKIPTTTSSLVAVIATQSPTPFPTLPYILSAPIQAQIHWQLKNRMMVPVTSFISPQEGWAATETQLIHTIDSGTTWQMVADTPDTFFALNFVNSMHGWGMGKDWLYVTFDGGKTWQRQASGQNDTGRGIWRPDIDFINDQIGWLTNDEGLFRTKDGGYTWQKVEIPNFREVTSLLSVSFSSIDKGWIMKGDCVMPMCDLTLLKTLDCGETWNPVLVEVNGEEKQSRPSMRPPDEIFFLDDQHGWFVGSSNILGEVTSDGGKTWNSLHSSSYMMGGGGIALHQIHMFTALQGIADLRTGSYYAVVRTNDGGFNWSQIFPPLTPNIYLQFFDQENGIGLSGGDFRSVFPFASADGGMTWHNGEFNAPCPKPMSYLQFVDRNNGWVICGEYRPYTLYKTTDGGKTWQPISTPHESLLVAHFWDAQTGIIADYDNQIYGTQDGGKTWKLVQLYQNKFPLRADQGGWIFDINGVIYHAGKNDSHWLPVLSIVYSSRFFPVSDNVAYAINKDFSRLIKTIDGGKTWIEISIPGVIEPNYYFGVSFIDQDLGWLASNNGLFKTKDGGMNWDQILPYISRSDTG
jgi:photosystem II stability/assembly factor-like uncharacterized protein